MLHTMCLSWLAAMHTSKLKLQKSYKKYLFVPKPEFPNQFSIPFGSSTYLHAG